MTAPKYFYVEVEDRSRIYADMIVDFNGLFIYFNKKGSSLEDLKRIIGINDNALTITSNIFYIYQNTYFVQNREYRIKPVPEWFVQKYEKYLKLAKY